MNIINELSHFIIPRRIQQNQYLYNNTGQINEFARYYITENGFVNLNLYIFSLLPYRFEQNHVE